MSLELSDVQVKMFESEVVHAFQNVGKLKNTVRVKNARGANQVQFNLMGKGQASARTNYQTPLPVMNIAHDPKTATVTDWTASELTDIFLNNQVGFDERQELVMTITNALGRRLDQIIIDELAGSSLTQIATNISGSTDDLTLATLREAAKILDRNGVPDEDRAFVCHVNGLHHLLEDSNVTSSDFNSIKALIQGDLDTYYGFRFVKIGNNDEGGLAIDGSDVRDNYAYHRTAVGLAMNMEPKITIDWDPQFGAHRVTGFMSAGAVVIDTNGALEPLSDET